MSFYESIDLCIYQVTAVTKNARQFFEEKKKTKGTVKTVIQNHQALPMTCNIKNTVIAN